MLVDHGNCIVACLLRQVQCVVCQPCMRDACLRAHGCERVLPRPWRGDGSSSSSPLSWTHRAEPLGRSNAGCSSRTEVALVGRRCAGSSLNRSRQDECSQNAYNRLSQNCSTNAVDLRYEDLWFRTLPMLLLGLIQMVWLLRALSAMPTRELAVMLMLVAVVLTVALAKLDCNQKPTLMLISMRMRLLCLVLLLVI